MLFLQIKQFRHLTASFEKTGKFFCFDTVEFPWATSFLVMLLLSKDKSTSGLAVFKTADFTAACLIVLSLLLAFSFTTLGRVFSFWCSPCNSFWSLTLFFWCSLSCSIMCRCKLASSLNKDWSKVEVCCTQILHKVSFGVQVFRFGRAMFPWAMLGTNSFSSEGKGLHPCPGIKNSFWLSSSYFSLLKEWTPFSKDSATMWAVSLTSSIIWGWLSGLIWEGRGVFNLSVGLTAPAIEGLDVTCFAFTIVLGIKVVYKGTRSYVISTCFVCFPSMIGAIWSCW